MENFDLKKFLVENKLTGNSRILNEENTLSNSEKSAAISKLGYSYPKLLAGSQQNAETAKVFKRSRDNKFTVKGTPYSEQEILSWFEEPWAEGMFTSDDKDAVNWFKKARYEGRGEKLYHEDDIDMLGWNMYMTPQQASHGLSLMQNYPVDVQDLDENNGYRDLTEFSVFKNYKRLS